jgi:hypothetical protein
MEYRPGLLPVGLLNQRLKFVLEIERLPVGPSVGPQAVSCNRGGFPGKAL